MTAKFNQYIKEAFSELIDDDDDFVSFDEYFDPGFDPAIYEGLEEYVGNKVIWHGEEGKTLKIPSEYVTPREDNIFDFKKVKAVRDHILHSDDAVHFETSYADVRLIDLETVQMTRQSYKEEMLGPETGLDEPFSTGNKEADEYLDGPDDWIRYELTESEYFKVGKDYKIVFDREKYKTDLKNKSIDEDTKDSLKYDLEMVNDINHALDQENGDLGYLWAVMRDGNHRTQGAILAGEPYIFVEPYVPSGNLESKSYYDELI